MASMLDRLRAAQPISSQPKAAPAALELLVKETCAQIAVEQREISRETLEYLGVHAQQNIPLENFLFVDTETTV